MSLQVWLPLNGDLNNQGLSNAIVTASGATVNSSGKIGSCYSFDGSDDYISLVGAAINNCFKGGTQQFSIAFWVYRADATRGIVFGDCGLTNAINFNLEFNTSHQFRFYWNGSPDKAFSAAVTASAWSHVVFTYDGTAIKYYLNGVLKETYAVTLGTKAKASGAAWYLGRDSRTGTTALNGRLNDFRLYNHCLSAKEVKEIFKGLVLHYKLTGNGQENLLKNTNFDSRYTSGTTSQHTSLLANDWDGYNSGVGNATTVYHAHLTQHDGQYVYRYVKNSSNSWLGISQYIKDKTTVGATYTFSCELYRVSGTNYPDGGHYTKASSSASNSFQTWFNFSSFQNAPVGQWIRYSATITVPASSYINDGVSFYIYGHTGGNGEFLMRHPKLEVGSKATPWMPNSSDAIYTSLGFNSTTEYDCSGYNHNGTKVKVTVSTDTPRYKTCNAFLGSTVDSTSNTLTGAAYITAGLPLPASSALTVSWWGKITKYSRGGIFETTGVTSDYVNGTDYSTTAIANWDNTFGVYNGSTRINLYSNMGIPNSSWQLNTITFDGASVKYYKNGALISTNALTGTLPAFNGIKIGIGKAGGVYRQIQQYVSDFRIYVTALTADDVKELYQIPIAVDKSGNVFAAEFIEDQKPEFEKTGIIENSYIHENEADDSDSLTTFHIGKTKTLANQIIEV